MSANDSPNVCNMEAICFSTNFQNFSAIQIIKQYFMSTNCFDIEYNKDFIVTFEHKILVGNNNSIACKISYTEMSSLSKNIKFNDENDCFIIFYDLEYSDSLVELNKILKMLSDLGDCDKKIYVVTLYTNKKNIKCNLNEEDAQSYFGRYMLNNYEIYIVDMESQSDLPNNIDKITIDVLQEKKLIANDSKELENDKSKSMCLII